MKKKLAALLCVLALVIPALCASEMTDADQYTCDACKYVGSFLKVVTGTETRDGLPGEWVLIQCSQCGEPYTTYWRQTGEAEVPAKQEPQAEPAPEAPEAPELPPQEPSPDTPVNPAEPEAPAAPPQEVSPDTPASPAEPEAPVTLPQDSSPELPGNGNGGQQEPAVVLPPENQQPSGPQAAETLPPVPADNPDPAPVNVPSGPAPQELPAEEPNNPPAGNPAPRVRRNLGKYPVFSAAYPSRRLNMEGDPEALAPIPGVQVYPELPAEGSSILRHMLDGD